MRCCFPLAAAATCVLVFLFDRLLPIDAGGTTIGVFAGAWLLALLATRRDVRARRGGGAGGWRSGCSTRLVGWHGMHQAASRRGH